MCLASEWGDDGGESAGALKISTENIEILFLSTKCRLFVSNRLLFERIW